MDKVFTNHEHCAWLREQARLKRRYWYGVYFLKCTEKLLQKKRKQYPAHYTDSRMARYRADIEAGQIAGDCVNGAIKGAVWSELGKRDPVYASHGCPDKSADGMFEYCKKTGMDWGTMDSMPDLPGVAVRYAGHVGVYVGSGEVVEWRGFKYGCVVTKLEGRKWLNWYKLPWTWYVENAGTDAPDETPAANLGGRLLKRGMKGDDVKLMQDMLMRLGYRLVKYGSDGDFGSETEEAVKAFQRREGLEVDGKYGNKSHAALMGRIAEIEDEEEGDRDAGYEGGQGPTGDGESAGLPSVPGAAGAVTGEFDIEVTGRTVNVREGAGTSYDVITVVRKGDILQAVATAGSGWHCVRLGDKMGWISGKYSRIRAEVYPAQP